MCLKSKIIIGLGVDGEALLSAQHPNLLTFFGTKRYGDTFAGFCGAIIKVF